MKNCKLLGVSCDSCRAGVGMRVLDHDCVFMKQNAPQAGFFYEAKCAVSKTYQT